MGLFVWDYKIERGYFPVSSEPTPEAENTEENDGDDDDVYESDGDDEDSTDEAATSTEGEGEVNHPRLHLRGGSFLSRSRVSSPPGSGIDLSEIRCAKTFSRHDSFEVEDAVSMFSANGPGA